uniref:Uncharacterized protein n=1 Tax=Octopus bimaculoides TaxID=37653 RepID=A0A0L8GWQ8_OCTBM
MNVLQEKLPVWCCRIEMKLSSFISHKETINGAGSTSLKCMKKLALIWKLCQNCLMNILLLTHWKFQKNWL